jgi:lipopolysaccharide export system protein LptC
MTTPDRKPLDGLPEGVKDVATRVMGPLLDIPSATERGRRALARYSRFVSTMKLVLPLVAGLLVAMVAIWPKFQGQDNRFQVGVGAVRAHEALDPSMIRPRYVGIDNGNLPYSIAAELAKNVVKGTEQVELDAPKADMTLKDGTWLALTADTGLYNRDEKLLTLEGGVNMFHDSGYEIKTTQAIVDLGQGAAAGDKPVEGHGPFGELNSQGFRMENKGSKIFFTGKSRVVIYPGFESSIE